MVWCGTGTYFLLYSENDYNVSTRESLAPGRADRETTGTVMSSQIRGKKKEEVKKVKITRRGEWEMQ